MPQNGANRLSLGCVIAILVAILAFWLIIGAWVPMCREEPGVFGDQFGAANSFFSALALAGVVVAIFLQQRSLELQHKEFIQANEELSSAARAARRAVMSNIVLSIYDIHSSDDMRIMYRKLAAQFRQQLSEDDDSAES